MRSPFFLSLFFIVFVVMLLPQAGDLFFSYLRFNDGCKVTSIIDGDTVKLKCPNEKEKSGRILGYDTPELSADCYGEWVSAKRETWRLRLFLWRSKMVETKITGKDRYGRALVHIFVNGKDVSQLMIKAGVARSYSGGRRPSWC